MRVGPSGSERPIVRVNDSAYVEVSDIVSDFNEAFFASEGLSRLGPIVEARIAAGQVEKPRASSSIAATAASNASWPPAARTARSRWPESRQRDTSLIGLSPSLARRGSRHTAAQPAGSPFGTTVAPRGPARGNSRCGRRGCSAGSQGAAASVSARRSTCRQAVVVGSAPSTVDGPWRKMPRKVQPYGSGDDTQAAASGPVPVEPCGRV
jgi:hypothetical protein